MVSDVTTWPGFLVWLATGPGFLTVVGFLNSYVLSRLPLWRDKVPSDLKVVLTVALAIGVSLWAKQLSVMAGVSDNPLLAQAFSFIVYYAANQYAYQKYFKTQ